MQESIGRNNSGCAFFWKIEHFQPGTRKAWVVFWPSWQPTWTFKGPYVTGEIIVKGDGGGQGLK